MIFLGKTFFADSRCMQTTPTAIESINYLEIGYAMYDEFYMTYNIESYDIPTIWQNDTIIHATFDGNTIAGNMNWYLDTIKDIIVKRKDENNLWITLYDQRINSVEDFNFEYRDYICNANTYYTYAIVPVSHDGVEGSYIYAKDKDTKDTKLKTEFNGITIVGKDKVYSTTLEVGDCDTTRNQKVGVVEMMYSKKPKIFINSQVNYQSGTASGLFLKYNESTNKFDPEDSYEYRKELMDFLTDGEPKIIKHRDGRTWLVMITGTPTDSTSEHHDKRIISFDWIEVGDVISEKDLYDNGLINANANYWSNYY